MPALPGAAVASSGAATHAVVKTDLLTADITSEGASLDYLSFTKHKDSDDKDRDFVLFGTHSYAAQTGLLAQGLALPTHQTAFTLAPGEARSVAATLRWRSWLRRQRCWERIRRRRRSTGKVPARC